MQDRGNDVDMSINNRLFEWSGRAALTSKAKVLERIWLYYFDLYEI